MSTPILSVGLAALLSVMSMPGHSRPQEPLTSTTPAASQDDPVVQAGRELSQLFLQGDTDAVWTRMSPQMQAALGSAAALAQFRAKLAQDLGEEQALRDESVSTHDGMRVYQRTANWSKAAGPVQMQWAMDNDGMIAGFFVRPKPQAAPSPYLDYQTRAQLHLPFKGDWHVFWGGMDIEQNYHAVAADQRFAYDFVQRVDGVSHRGDGHQLSDYYCWNEPILAPAKGTVVAVVDGLLDQAIGTANPQSPAGNHVMLDLGHDEYALIAHLQQGSVAVEAGEHVEAGQQLGLCGNSGNTSEPHLHFHLQDSPVFGQGLGLPAYFNDYVADGQPVERGIPVRGQAISPQPR